MTKEELVARLQDIEWDDFEVKAVKDGLPKSVWETVCAFSVTGNPIRIETPLSSLKVTFYFRPTEENQGVAKKDGDVGVNDPLIDPLSIREKEILNFLDTSGGLGRNHLVDKMGVSEATIKELSKNLKGYLSWNIEGQRKQEDMLLN